MRLTRWDDVRRRALGSRAVRVAVVTVAMLIVAAAGLAQGTPALADTTSLQAPPAGMAGTPDDHGYWVAGRDGSIASFGDAGFYNSLPGLGVHVSNIVGMAPTPDGRGYWLAGADGGVFAFGDANFYGSMGGINLNGPVVTIAATHSGRGYWMSATDGGLFAFGDAPYLGRPTVPGSGPGNLRTSITQRANTELGLGFTETSHNNCNPYSGYWQRGGTNCPPGQRTESWCADFAAYVWQHAGASVSGITASASSFQSTATSRGTWKPRSSGYVPQPGDAVVFGNTHVGVIVVVNSPTSVEMISGNYSDAVSATWFNPATFTVSGTPVSGYAQPAS